MHPVSFEGAQVINKPENMTDEQCLAIWAKYGFELLRKVFERPQMAELPPDFYKEIDEDKFSFFVTAWQPNREDIQAINEGRPIYLKVVSNGLPPMAVFTLDSEGQPNI